MDIIGPFETTTNILMDLIDPFETSTIGTQYNIKVTCMLTNYVVYIPVIDKSANTVVNAYLRE